MSNATPATLVTYLVDVSSATAAAARIVGNLQDDICHKLVDASGSIPSKEFAKYVKSVSKEFRATVRAMYSEGSEDAELRIETVVNRISEGKRIAIALYAGHDAAIKFGASQMSASACLKVFATEAKNATDTDGTVGTEGSEGGEGEGNDVPDMAQLWANLVATATKYGQTDTLMALVTEFASDALVTA